MTSLRERLGLRLPLVLAPMAGGVSTPALVAAVSEAGGLGSLGAAYLSPAEILKAGQEIRRQTARPWALNLFAPQEVLPVSGTQVTTALAELAPFHAELGLPAPGFSERPEPDFAEQLAAALSLRPAALSFTFGLLSAAQLAQVRAAGALAIGTATGVDEARALAAAGVDAVVVQGGAAGGHRGGWQHDELADTFALTRAVAQVVDLPLIAAGGLMTAGDVRSALDTGAELAQCGTAFLLADEAGTSAPYRAALAHGGETVLTRSFSGRPARGLKNAVTEGVQHPLPYPQQNALTRPMRTAAAQAGRAEFLSLWAGTGVGQVRPGPATEVARALAGEG